MFGKPGFVLFLSAALARQTGCSKDAIVEMTDTGGPDVDVTSPTADTGDGPSAGPLVVTVENTAGPYVGARVVFHDPSGAVLGTEVTDDAGVASWPSFPEGGGVTAATSGRTSRLSTMLDLAPGALSIEPVVDIQTVGTMEVRLPPPFPGAETYDFGNGCAGALDVDLAKVHVVEVDPTCLDEDQRGFLVAVAYDADGLAIAHATEPSLFVGRLAPAQVWLDSWRTDFQRFDVSLDGVPDRAASIQILGYDMHRGLIGYGDFFSSAPGPDPLTAPGMRLTGAMDDILVIARVNYEGTGLASSSEYSRGLGTVPAELNLGLTGQMPPRLHEVDFDIASSTISWTLDGPFPQADVARLSLNWTRGTNGYEWIVAGPVPPEQRLVLPELPQSLETWMFTSPGDFVENPLVLLHGGSAIEGWPDLRARFTPFWESRMQGPTPFETYLAIGI
ncbi:MAG: hypothetical protein AAF602_03640 [Myxococcota bacterium]